MRLFILIMIIICGVNTAHADAEIKIQRLSDRLYYVPDEKAKTIDFQMIVNAGCYDEANNSCLGIAHYLEHIILIGRNSGSTGIAFRFFPDAYANGWTTNITTAYVHKVPLKGGLPEPILEKLFDFYGKRLSGFDITPQDATRERNVVQQEYDYRYGSKPENLFLLKASALEIPQHPHDQTAAGTPQSIAAFTVAQAKAFHQRWYSKDNVSFIITGNIEPQKLKELADSALKDVISRPVPSHEWKAMPSFKAETVDIRGSDKQTERTKVYMSKIVQIPDGNYFKTRASQIMLQSFLSSKLTGSPYSVLVEQQVVASDVNVEIQNRLPNVYEFDLTATLADDVTVDKLKEAMTRYTEQLSSLPLNDVTIERLKKRFTDGWSEGADKADQVTSRLVGWVAKGLDYDELAQFPVRVAEVKRADVEAQAAAIASKGRVVFAILEPEMNKKDLK